MTKKIVIGRFGKVHGLEGWLRVVSFAEPQENIIDFVPWLINKNGKWQVVCLENSRLINHGVLVKLKGVNDCEMAREYTNLDINIERNQLPLLPNKQYYWLDLEGLRVLDNFGKELGIVDRLLATGANDVLVIKQGAKELLVPYIKDVIVKVDLENKLVEVDYEF
jgi:16S rRNA processing protein RimM